MLILISRSFSESMAMSYWALKRQIHYPNFHVINVENDLDEIPHVDLQKAQGTSAEDSNTDTGGYGFQIISRYTIKN